MKSYGKTHALRGVNLELRHGEILGLVGHNGAGKSTLMRVLAGIELPDGGKVSVRAQEATTEWNAESAAQFGVRMVYQELALCDDLTVSETVALSDPRPTGMWGWRGQAECRVLEALDKIFPGHGISVLRRAGELAMAERQMVEIARAFCTDNLTLVILDEPTESLGSDATAQLYSWLRELKERGVSILLISHRMQEIIANSDRIAVMKDGAVVEVFDATSSSEAELLVAMGGEVRAETGQTLPNTAHEPSHDRAPASVSVKATSGIAFEARPGELIGLAGLAGQGQEQLLTRLWRAGAMNRSVTVPSRRAYVPGDRQTSGIFPLWSVAENLTISALPSLGRFGFIGSRAKRELAAQWIDALKVRGNAATPITSLSGGNQQKVLVARAFASDSELVLLDDPFRGVDVATKNELYTLMKSEAASGRCIVWYSTENSEMAHCDRVYVFRANTIISELSGPSNTEERIIADSFEKMMGT
jgi:ribose transport system ATP-binding protein